MNRIQSLRILIADDEPLARKKLRRLLAGDPGIEIVAECSTGTEALAAVHDLAPDLIFMDVQMPDLDGVSVSTTLGDEKIENGPMIIFVTAYDQYAVRAFELNAVDYLLKPFDRSRLNQALARARERLGEKRQQAFNRQILEVLSDLKARPPYLDRLVINKDDRIFVLKTDEIDWIEAEGNYVRIHFGGQSSLLRETLTRLETSLDPRKFPRIHRSRLVNIDRIQELQHWSRRDYRIILRNGAQLTISQKYRDQLDRLLGRL